jgi:DNA primase catalytic subunit
MSKYFMPEGMRPATLEERRQFYTTEFKLQKVVNWIKGRAGKTKFAVIIGQHTGIYPAAYKEDADTTIIVDEYTYFEEVRNQIVAFLPESVYYDRVTYGAYDHVTGQELAFDLDPENITCPIHGTLADKMERNQGLSFCTLELEMVKDQTVRLYEYLERQFSQMRIVYSGRGFHIHVFDIDAYALTTAQRTEMAETVKAKGFNLDTWVTAGEMHLIRLPYSLHGMVSRIVLPLEKKEVLPFDPVNDVRCMPEFLVKKTATSF